MFLDHLLTGVQFHAYGVMVKAVAHQDGLLPSRQRQTDTASLPSLSRHPARLERLHAKRHGLADIVSNGQIQCCPRSWATQGERSHDAP